MLKSKKTLIACLAVFGMGMGTMHVSSALAQRPGVPGGRHWAHFGGKAGAQSGEEDCPMAKLIHQRLAGLFNMKEELNLTTEQRDAIHTILRNHADDLKPVVKAVIEKHQTLHDAVLADETDEQAIRAAATELGGTIGDAAVVAAQVAKEVKAVLTPDQLKILCDFRADHQGAIEEFMQHLSGE